MRATYRVGARLGDEMDAKFTTAPDLVLLEEVGRQVLETRTAMTFWTTMPMA